MCSLSAQKALLELRTQSTGVNGKSCALRRPWSLDADLDLALSGQGRVRSSPGANVLYCLLASHVLDVDCDQVTLVTVCDLLMAGFCRVKVDSTVEMHVAKWHSRQASFAVHDSFSQATRRWGRPLRKDMYLASAPYEGDFLSHPERLLFVESNRRLGYRTLNVIVS